MNFRIFSRIVVWWIFVDLVIRSCWFSDNFHPDSEFIRLIRIVVPLLLSVGVAIMSYANGRMERLLKNRDGESLCFCAYSYWWAFLFSSVGIKKYAILEKCLPKHQMGRHLLFLSRYDDHRSFRCVFCWGYVGNTMSNVLRDFAEIVWIPSFHRDTETFTDQISPLPLFPPSFSPASSLSPSFSLKN